ncbi:MAG TPA: SRPBCC family protein [Kineosporiaceae bacterium]|nr:SRPBCC family protein [Kineosporiaceae bacterium]
MTTIEQSIDVEVPIHAVYDQWTQFEGFPEFMEGVERVEQLDDAHLHWVTRVAGVEREFDAVITEQVPDQRIGWRSVQGPTQAGQVSFSSDEPSRTHVTLVMDFEPEGVVEQAGDKLGLVKSRVQGDLERFKQFIESRGEPTGAWRGTVSDEEATGGTPV